MKPNFEGLDLRDGLDRIHLASSDGGSTNGSSSLVHKLPPPPGMMAPRGEFDAGLIEVPSCENISAPGEPDSTAMLLKLHARLGGILREACDLHQQIGHLLVATKGEAT